MHVLIGNQSHTLTSSVNKREIISSKRDLLNALLIYYFSAFFVEEDDDIDFDDYGKYSCNVLILVLKT